MNALSLGAALTALWVLLWGKLSVANVLSGILVAAVLIAILPGERRRTHFPVIRPAALVRLGLYLLRQLVISNVVLAREVLRPKSGLSTGIVGVPIPGCSDMLLTLMANFWAMAPGTMPVEVQRSPCVIYVHVLHLHAVEEVRRELIRLRDLTVAAFGSDEAVAAIRSEQR